MEDLLHDLVRLVELIRDNNASIFLSIVGLLLFLIAIVFVRKAVEEGKEAPTWLKTGLFISLLGAILASVAAPSLRMLELSRHRSAAPLDPSHILRNLAVNAKVTWLVRLIPYNPGNKNLLGIGHLAKLGRATQRYVFVADYAELRGRTVADAVAKVGGSMNQVTGVSAVIFPLAGDLYPANARGLLQVIRNVDERCAANPGECLAQPGYKSFDVEKRLSSDEKDQLADNDIDSWGWENYGHFYGHFCELAQTFRCAERSDQFSAAPLIGNLFRDWHPLGFSQLAAENPCLQKFVPCAVTSWDQTSKLVKHLGVRAFLIENAPLEDLAGVRLIDFTNPHEDLIPDLGVLPDAGSQ